MYDLTLNALVCSECGRGHFAVESRSAIIAACTHCPITVDVHRDIAAYLDSTDGLALVECHGLLILGRFDRDLPDFDMVQAAGLDSTRGVVSWSDVARKLAAPLSLAAWIALDIVLVTAWLGGWSR